MALKKPYPLARAFRNDEMHCQRVLCDYLHLLERWKVEYAHNRRKMNWTTVLQRRVI